MVTGVRSGGTRILTGDEWPDMMSGMPESGLGIYIDDGKVITTNSMLKTFRRCPKQTEYKYIRRLKPKVLGRPLRNGTWIHALMETMYKGGDWKEKHKELTGKFSMLFDEEKDEIGDLPRDCSRTMRSYLWHYALDEWKVHECEFTLEVELPDGSMYRCRLDLLIENQYGLWIVDHKTHKRLPDHNYRIMDVQSALYTWAALKNKIPVQGHIWNYLRSKPPAVPQLAYAGTTRQRLSKREVETDYPTLARVIKAYKLDKADYMPLLRRLYGMRYQPGEMQMSPLFRRDILEKTPGMLKSAATEAFATHVRMHSYHWDRVQAIERVPDRSCTFMCSYTDLCMTEFMGGNTSSIMRNYEVGDPLDYYYDEAPGVSPGKGED